MRISCRLWRRLRIFGGLCAIVALTSASASATDTIRIDAETLADGVLLPDGTKAADALTAQQLARIRGDGLVMNVGPTTREQADELYLALTRKNPPATVLDPETKRVTGWVSGAPFPDVQGQSPDAGWRIIWNAVYGHQGADRFEGRLASLNIGKDDGLQSVSIFSFKRFRVKGAISKRQDANGDLETLRKILVTGLAPQQVAGFGNFVRHLDTGAPSEGWIYIPGFGPPIEVPGDVWVEDMEGTVQAGDDVGIFGAYPTWYETIRLLGERRLLVSRHSQGVSWKPSENGGGQEFPRFDLAASPGWNPVDRWEARKVYVIEAIPPESHRYGRKVIYVDQAGWQIYRGEAYDRDGRFWRDLSQGFRTQTAADGRQVTEAVWGLVIDRSEDLATAWVSDIDSLNGDLAPEEVSLEALKALAAR